MHGSIGGVEALDDERLRFRLRLHLRGADHDLDAEGTTEREPDGTLVVHGTARGRPATGGADPAFRSPSGASAPGTSASPRRPRRRRDQRPSWPVGPPGRRGRRRRGRQRSRGMPSTRSLIRLRAISVEPPPIDPPCRIRYSSTAIVIAPAEGPFGATPRPPAMSTMTSCSIQLPSAWDRRMIDAAIGGSVAGRDRAGDAGADLLVDDLAGVGRSPPGPARTGRFPCRDPWRARRESSGPGSSDAAFADPG